MNKIKLFYREWEVTKCTHPTLGDGFEIRFTAMYKPPKLNSETLIKLSDYFGTVEIDFDNYSRRGCETCDYDSEYGYLIEVYKATKNIPEIE